MTWQPGYALVLMLRIRFLLAAWFFTAGSCAQGWTGGPAAWVPARWEGGPLEVARRAGDPALAKDPSLREAIAGWYDPATLALLQNSPVNCLLVTFSAGAARDIETRQHELIQEYARRAKARGLAVLGIVYPGAEPSAVAAAAREARLDGVVLDGEFPSEGYAGQLERALLSAGAGATVIPIAATASSVRTKPAPLLAVQGVRPSARNLADMGIRAGASAEPWIESNIWLVRSFRLNRAGERMIWINQAPKPSLVGDYIRCVADAAVAGGRWIVALDDGLRAGLFRKEPGALATWRSIGTYLEFAENHSEWRSFVPYGQVALVLDTASETPDISEEYLNLVARRHVPYRLVLRSELSPASLAGFQAVLAMDLDPPTPAERKTLRDFADQGGLVVTGPSWGDPPKDEPYAELPVGKGRVVVYKDDPPDPAAVARDMLDLLAPEVMGLSVFNVASAISYVSTADSGRRVLIQLLNYASVPANRVTIRFNGAFKTARLFTPESAPVDLAVRRTANGRTEVVAPKLIAWGAVLLE